MPASTPTQLFAPDPLEVAPSKSRVARRAKLPRLPPPEDPLFDPLAQAYRLGLTHFSPRGAWKTLDAPAWPVLPETFAGCARVTLAVVSAGEGLDAVVDAALAQGRTRDAWLLDAFGSEAVEAVADALDARLREIHGEGTRRFSPGYGHLLVTENIRIIAELGVDFAVAHPASGMLSPRKSVVFLIGWHG